MAVEKIKFISIGGPLDKLDETALVCGQSGIFHCDSASQFYDNAKSLTPIVVNNTYSEYLERLKNVLDTADIKISDNFNESLCTDTEDILKFTEEFSDKVGKLYKEKSDNDKLLLHYRLDAENANHFASSEIDLKRLDECEFVKSRFGKIPLESYSRIVQNENKLCFIFIQLSQDDEYCYGVYVTPSEFIDEAERILSRLYFEPIDTSLIEAHENDEGTIKELSEKSLQIEKELLEYIGENKDFAISCCYKLNELAKIEKIKGNGLIHKSNFILTGWIPAKEEQSFTQKLSQIDAVACTTSTGRQELKHKPPIKLKNNFFSKPFEFYVDMFGLPSYDEIDPTAFVAITYTLLFGIMFGDFGQGIVLSIAGYLMWKLKKMKLGKLLVPCGISSAFFGLVYGSVFGFEHALDPMYKALGFESKPIEVMESQTINMIIYAAVGIGVALVIVAMLLNVYSSLRRKDFGRAMCGSSGVAGIMFYSSLVVGVLLQLFMGVKVLTPVYVVCLIVIPLIVMYLQEPLSNLLNGKKHPAPEKWGEYLIQSFFELFETMLSYVSNTMSFLRVGAFVLVHAGMMMVVSILAGDPGSISFVIIEIFGNIFVIALEGLLVGIQVLRLEFYEMFSRFYTGSGRPFVPVKIKNFD